MELFDEDFQSNEKIDNKKGLTIVLVLIIFFIVMVLLIIGVMIYIKQTTLSVTLNGQESSMIKNMIKIDDENPQNVYVPIRKIAKTLGYNDYSGNYITKSEEKNQCYVENDNEVAMFTLNSKVIYKTLKDGDSNFDYYTINNNDKDAVISIDGELYTTIDGIEKAFNVSWNNDIENKKMNIYTMPSLVEIYSSRIKNNYYNGINGDYTISEDFTNQKATLQGMIIIEKEGSNSSYKKVAVLDASTGDLILEPKYDEIQYLEHTKDFLVTADGKKGIISSQKRTIAKLQYDDIQLMDVDRKLYLVENSNKYGIIDFDGKKILDAEYNEIGIDNSKFKQNEIKSKYIIADTLIPVKNGEQWGFFDANGKQITEFKYDKIGYTTTNNKAGSGYSLLVVPEYNVIVVGTNEKYTVMFIDGKEAWPMSCDSIYLSISGGVSSYLFEYNSDTFSVTEQLDRLGYGKNSKKSNNQDNEEDNQNVEDDQNEEENQNEEDNQNVEDDQNEEDNQNEESNEEEQENYVEDGEE